MKCPMCGGIGLTDLHTPNVGRCIKCNGSGEIEPTNKEYMRSCTTEQLAGAIYEWYTLGYTRGKNGVKLNSITEVVEWLKEKHDGNVL